MNRLEREIKEAIERETIRIEKERHREYKFYNRTLEEKEMNEKKKAEFKERLKKLGVNIIEKEGKK